MRLVTKLRAVTFPLVYPGSATPLEYLAPPRPQREALHTGGKPTLGGPVKQAHSLCGYQKKWQSRGATQLDSESTSLRILSSLAPRLIPLRSIRDIGCNNGKIFLFWRADDVDDTTKCRLSCEQTAMPTCVFWIVLNHLSLENNLSHFGGRNHPFGLIHLSDSVREEQ